MAFWKKICFRPFGSLLFYHIFGLLNKVNSNGQEKKFMLNFPTDFDSQIVVNKQLNPGHQLHAHTKSSNKIVPWIELIVDIYDMIILVK